MEHEQQGPTKQEELEMDARYGKQFYSIRAKFYDRYRGEQPFDDLPFEKLLFKKLDELEKIDNPSIRKKCQ